eukprot:5924387-Pyramimonas_sp.AAC.1
MSKRTMKPQNSNLGVVLWHLERRLLDPLRHVLVPLGLHARAHPEAVKQGALGAAAQRARAGDGIA